jgi:hypothetical protein
MTADARADIIARYLRTGSADLYAGRWAKTFIENEQAGSAALKSALIGELSRLTTGMSIRPSHGDDGDRRELVRQRVEPMVRGLFPFHEQDIVLDTVVRSFVFVDAGNIGTLVQETPWLSTAWMLANLYLNGAGAELLSAEAPRVVGYSEETTCYVGQSYWSSSGPLDDFIVHEAAHVFHNCRRSTLGFAETRRREWLLNVDYRMRETFAYACEAYRRLIEYPVKASRREFLETALPKAIPPDDRVDPEEWREVLRDALAVRNGWKRILARCAARPARLCLA